METRVSDLVVLDELVALVAVEVGGGEVYGDVGDGGLELTLGLLPGSEFFFLSLTFVRI